MQTVTVDKAQLLKQIDTNLQTHKEDFEIAWQAYAEAVVKNAEELLKSAKQVKKGEPVSLFINLTMPVDHTEDYERAIEMLKWNIGDDIELSEAEFTQLVQDDWGWKGQFSATNQFYTGSVSPSSIRRK